ncbi:MAG: sortase [Eubacteriales bacterium]|nr:sortase [Eubacteriales bacterium]
MDNKHDKPRRPQGRPNQRPARPEQGAGGPGPKPPQGNRRPAQRPGQRPPRPGQRPERPPFEKLAGVNSAPQVQPAAQRPAGPERRRRAPGAVPQRPVERAQDRAPARAASRPSTRPPRPPKKAKPKQGMRALMILLDVLIIGLFLAGIFFALYPRWVNSKQMSMRDKILESFKAKPGENVSFEIGKDEYKVPGERLEDWSTQDGQDFVEEVEVPGGKVTVTYIGRLVIAKIGCDTPLSPVLDHYHLRFGASILQSSAPLNQAGQTVIFGHRFLTKGRDFNRLDEINTGDSFFIDVAEENLRYIYRVDKQLIVPQNNYKDYVFVPNNVAPGYSAEDNTILLVTCHPAVYAAQDERLLIFAHLESTEPIK